MRCAPRSRTSWEHPAPRAAAAANGAGRRGGALAGAYKATAPSRAGAGRAGGAADSGRAKPRQTGNWSTGIQYKQCLPAAPCKQASTRNPHPRWRWTPTGLRPAQTLPRCAAARHPAGGWPSLRRGMGVRTRRMAGGRKHSCAKRSALLGHTQLAADILFCWAPRGDQRHNRCVRVSAPRTRLL